MSRVLCFFVTADYVFLSRDPQFILVRTRVGRFTPPPLSMSVYFKKLHAGRLDLFGFSRLTGGRK